MKSWLLSAALAFQVDGSSTPRTPSDDVLFVSECTAPEPVPEEDGEGCAKKPAATTSTPHGLSGTPGSSALSGSPPTQNTDGSSLVNLAGYTIYYGTSATALNAKVNVANPGATAFTVTGLASGTWYFAVTAYSADGIESALSNVSTKVMP